MKAETSITWSIVSQVKSHRVVYFTDDPEYAPPSDGDWYYVSPHIGALPEGMTLRNCWHWRFDGAVFTYAEKQAKHPGEALLDANKAALRKLLREKVEDALKPLAPMSPSSAQVRTMQLAEARDVLRGATEGVRLLPNAAAVRGITLREAAQAVVQQHEDWERLLCAVECHRDELAHAIDAATRQDQLVVVRQRLMKEIAAETTPGYAVKASDLTPERASVAPSGEELPQEQLRLRVQLRLKINALRRPWVSDYLLDDVVLRFKGRLAQSVLSAGGAVPPGTDAAPLVSHAAARGMTLSDAARDVLGEMDETARVLLETEQMKEAVLVRIASVRSFGEIADTGRIIEALRVQVPVQPAKAVA
jgi:hypothetical protein